MLLDRHFCLHSTWKLNHRFRNRLKCARSLELPDPKRLSKTKQRNNPWRPSKPFYLISASSLSPTVALAVCPAHKTTTIPASSTPTANAPSASTPGRPNSAACTPSALDRRPQSIVPSRSGLMPATTGERQSPDWRPSARHNLCANNGMRLGIA